MWMIMLCFESMASSTWLIHWFYASHQHEFSPDCVLAASPIALSPTAMRPSTLQHLLSSRRPWRHQPLSPSYLCRQGSRPKKKSSPAGWPYSSACWLLVSSWRIAKYLSDSVLFSFFFQSAKNLYAHCFLRGVLSGVILRYIEYESRKQIPDHGIHNNLDTT